MFQLVPALAQKAHIIDLKLAGLLLVYLVWHIHNLMLVVLKDYKLHMKLM